MPENRLEIIISLVLKEQPVGLKPRQPFFKTYDACLYCENLCLYCAEYLRFISLFC